MRDFGNCPYCGGLLAPVYYTEDETTITDDGYMYRTGRKRRAISHLVCESCLRNQCIDDSYDGLWIVEVTPDE